MNERILELAKEAGYKHPDAVGSCEDYAYFDHAKFAELIIQECTQLLFDESERLYAYTSECDNMRHSDDAEMCAEKCMDNIRMITEHFGVEEDKDSACPLCGEDGGTTCGMPDCQY